MPGERSEAAVPGGLLAQAPCTAREQGGSLEAALRADGHSRLHRPVRAGCLCVGTRHKERPQQAGTPGTPVCVSENLFHTPGDEEPCGKARILPTAYSVSLEASGTRTVGPGACSDCTWTARVPCSSAKWRRTLEPSPGMCHPVRHSRLITPLLTAARDRGPDTICLQSPRSSHQVAPCPGEGPAPPAWPLQARVLLTRPVIQTPRTLN